MRLRRERSWLRTFINALCVACDLLTGAAIILWILQGPKFEPWVTAFPFFGSVLSRVLTSRFLTVGQGPPITARDSDLARRGRAVMLGRVRHDWIEGVLERSLYQVARIELDMVEAPHAVDRPWSVVLRTPDQGARLLERGTRMATLFEQMDGALLILQELAQTPPSSPTCSHRAAGGG